jgi:hypothetical protein
VLSEFLSLMKRFGRVGGVVLLLLGVAALCVAGWVVQGALPLPENGGALDFGKVLVFALVAAAPGVFLLVNGAVDQGLRSPSPVDG